MVLEEADDLRRRLMEGALGLRDRGAPYWPGASHFLLLELDTCGSCTGEARTVCPACVSDAAQFVLHLAERGGAPLFDLVGEAGSVLEPCCCCGISGVDF